RVDVAGRRSTGRVEVDLRLGPDDGEPVARRAMLADVARDLHRLREWVAPVDGARDLVRRELEQDGARREQGLAERRHEEDTRKSPAEPVGTPPREKIGQRSQPQAR